MRARRRPATPAELAARIVPGYRVTWYGRPLLCCLDVEAELDHVAVHQTGPRGIRRTEQLENGCWTADAHFFFGLLGVVVAGYGRKVL